PLVDADVPFYAAPRNHDDPAIQMKYKRFNMDGRRFYTFSKGPAQFFALDSTYMSPQQLKWLEEELSQAKAKWKIVYMHHPIYSSGKRHGSDIALRTFIEPLLQKYGVDLALAGHEHFYERIRPQKGIQYFTAGSAGKLREGNIRHGPLHEAGFDTDLSFMLMEIDGDDLHFQVISRLGTTVDHGRFVRRGADSSARLTPTEGYGLRGQGRHRHGRHEGHRTSGGRALRRGGGRRRLLFARGGRGGGAPPGEPVQGAGAR